MVYVADADIIKQITTKVNKQTSLGCVHTRNVKQFFIKDFESFHGHLFKFGDQKFRTLDIADGEEWRELRKGNENIFSRVHHHNLQSSNII